MFQTAKSSNFPLDWHYVEKIEEYTLLLGSDSVNLTLTPHLQSVLCLPITSPQMYYSLVYPGSYVFVICITRKQLYWYCYIWSLFYNIM